MKKLLTIASVFIFTTAVSAATATPSATPTDNPSPTSGAQQKLDTLKDRLASAATQLSQSQRRAIAGTVKTTSVSTITVETATKDVKIELTDTIKVAQIIKGKRTALTTDDLAKGDTVVVFGDYDTNLDLLKAKVIFIQSAPPTRIAGRITDNDKKGFTITVVTPEGQSYIVDVETTTKNILWNKTDGTSKGAFSKLLPGDTVHVLGALALKTENRISAQRVLDIGNLTGTTPASTPTPTSTASPSATVKTTPKPTPKPTATPTP